MLQREQTVLSIRVGTLLVGLLIGVLLGSRIFASSSDTGALSPVQQEYLLMNSTLYNYASPNYDDDDIASRLSILGDLPAVKAQLESLARQYRDSPDITRKQYAAGLERLASYTAARIASGKATTPVAPIASGSSVQTPPRTAVAGQSSPAAGTPRPAGTVQPAITPASPNNPQPTQPAAQPTGQPGTGEATPPAQQSKTGTIISQVAGANIRAEPKSNSALVTSLPVGTKVEILNIVEGEAVDGSEKRWYHIRWAGDKTGYVYFKLLKPD